MDRSARRDVRNPLLALPAMAQLDVLSPEARAALRALCLDLRTQARAKEVTSYAKRKGPMVAYWMAVATYAKHLANVLR
jgi:hypothetical protein